MLEGGSRSETDGDSSGKAGCDESLKIDSENWMSWETSPQFGHMSPSDVSQIFTTTDGLPFPTCHSLRKGSQGSEVDRREYQCLKLTLALVDRGAYYESLRIVANLLKLIRDYIVGRQLLHRWLDSSKVAFCVFSNSDVIMTGIVEFYGLMVMIYLLSLLLTENLGKWADFSGIGSLI